MQLLALNAVLVTTDLNESSLPALRTAARLAPIAGASLHLLHVTGNHSADEEARLAEHFRMAAPDSAGPDDVCVVMGLPAPAIVSHARAVGADVVILGPHRHVAEPARPLGSTAASVVRASHCPCLVAAAELRLPLERVLVAVDDSESAHRALSVGLCWASALRPRGTNVTLSVLHVAHPGTASSALDGVRHMVGQARDLARDYGRVDVSERIVTAGDPASAILEEAASAGPDLLVMGTRQTLHAVPELGSVSAAVTQATPCPLLLVPPGTQ